MSDGKREQWGWETACEIHTLAFEEVNAEVAIGDDGEVQIAFREMGAGDNPVLLTLEEFWAFAGFVERHAQARVGS